MRHLLSAVMCFLLPLSMICLQSCNVANPGNAEKYLLSIFPEIPMIAPPGLDKMGVKPFDGIYPPGWPAEITVPTDSRVLYDGKIVSDPLGGSSYSLYFVYKGDAGSLCQQLQSKGAWAGYTYVKPAWKGIPQDYRQYGIEWYARLFPGDDSKCFTYQGQVFPNCAFSFWCVEMTY